MDELRKIWLACAVDTEGSIHFEKHRGKKHESFSIRISLCNTNLHFVQKAQEICGIGHIGLEPKVVHLPVYRWYIGKASECERILREILPYLIIKKGKAEQALLFLKYRRQKGKYARHGIVEKIFADNKESEIKNILELL